MIAIPIEVLLSWPRPNYVDPETRGPAVWIVTTIFIAIATSFVVARLYARIFVRRWFGLDDFLIVAALLCAISVNAVVTIGNIRLGWTRHAWDVPIDFMSPGAKLLYLARLLWGQSVSFVRLSVLILFYRLAKASGAPRHYYLVLHAVTAYTIGLYIVYIYVGIFPCLPIREYWVFPFTQDHCINEATLVRTCAILNTFNEFIIASLPIVGVVKLRVTKAQRLAVIFVLSLGYIVVFAGCMRTYYLWKGTESYDLTWWGTPLWIWQEAEVDLSLICACAAPLRPVFGRLAHRMRQIPIKFPSGLTTRMTSQSELQRSHDFEAMAEWQASMLRKVDLEGIINDTIGYTVHISGPAAPTRRKSVFTLCDKGGGSEDGDGANRGSEDDIPEDRGVGQFKAGLEISHKTDVTILESPVPCQ